MLLAVPALAVSTFRGLEPGRSTIADAGRVLGTGSGVGPGRMEYRLADNTGVVLVTAGAGDVIDEIEWRFREPVAREPLVQRLRLAGTQPSAPDSGGRTAEYFGGPHTLVMVHAGAGPGTPVAALRYLSAARFDAERRPAGGPPPSPPPPAPPPQNEVRTQYNPKECEDLYAWARQEQVTAEKSRDKKRRQDVLEIRILSQRGECETSRRLVDEYKRRYR